MQALKHYYVRTFSALQTEDRCRVYSLHSRNGIRGINMVPSSQQIQSSLTFHLSTSAFFAALKSTSSGQIVLYYESFKLFSQQ